MVEFVSYDGEFPALCCGVLTLKINGKPYVFPPNCMRTGGCITFDDDYFEHIEHGPWSIIVPEELSQFKEEITKCVNENVPWGCCGGCV